MTRACEAGEPGDEGKDWKEDGVHAGKCSSGSYRGMASDLGLLSERSMQCSAGGEFLPARSQSNQKLKTH